MAKTIEHVMVPVATLRRPGAQGAHFVNVIENPLAKYLQHLKRVGIEDPVGVQPDLDRTIELRRHMQAIGKVKVATDLEADLTRKLAAGEITTLEAAKRLQKMPPDDAEKEAKRKAVVVLGNAASIAFNIGVLKIRDYGEERWLDLLQSIAKKAVADKDQVRFDAVHKLAAFLRTPQVAALSHAASGRSEVALVHYMVRAWNLVYHWRADRAQKSWAMSTEFHGENAFVVTGFHEAPFPTLAEMDSAWGIGLFSAAEAIVHMDAVYEQQEAEKAGAEPERVHGRAVSA